jgi:type IV pilus assembly protein PilB
MGIHEILVVSREIRDLINRGASADQICQTAIRQGTVTLRDSCSKLVLDGMTTVDELLKVTYSVD